MFHPLWFFYGGGLLESQGKILAGLLLLFTIPLPPFTMSMKYIRISPADEIQMEKWSSQVRIVSSFARIICSSGGHYCYHFHGHFVLNYQVLLGAWLNAIGAGVRILSGLDFVLPNIKFIVVMIGQTSASLAQPFLLGSPTKLAALWFGADERATANMIASLSEFHY